MAADHEESVLVSKGPCPSCGSSDANALYSDGHTHCFSCGTTDRSGVEGGGGRTPAPAADFDPLPGDYQALRARHLTEETCRRFGYQTGSFKGQPVQIAPYRDPETGALIAQKLRFADKSSMPWLGNGRKPPLFGQHITVRSYRRVVVTEGELDALSVSQAGDNKWPVVSIPLGTKDAADAFARQLAWLSRFEQVIICFDMDDNGREASEAAARVLPLGKAFIAKLPLKDASEMLKAGRGPELISATFDAAPYRPSGVVSFADIRDEVETPIEWGLPWAWETLTKLTYGRRFGEAYALGAGTGIGKTDFLTQQIDHDVVTLGLKVGVFSLEQKPAETAKRLAGKRAGRRFHIPRECDQPEWVASDHPGYVPEWTVEELRAAIDALDKEPRLFFYDSFGANEWGRVQETIRYLYHAEGVRVFYLDHLTALAAAEDDERTGLERIMSEMGSLVKEIPIILTFVSHLATPEGKPHEEGGRVAIRHFKGSRAIGFWSHFMFGLERNQQDPNPDVRGTTTFRVLKDRYTGNATGEVFYLGYDRDTGRLYEREAPAEEGAGFQDESGGADQPF